MNIQHDPTVTRAELAAGPITDLITIPPLAWQVAAATIAAAVTLTGLWFAVRAARRRPLEDTLTVVAATIATGVSAQGMWQFIDRTLHLHPVLQFLMFAFIEVAVITSAVRAKRSMEERFSAGIDGIAVWALTALSAVLSAMEAASLPEAIFRLAAPLVAAWLWERGMAIERHRATGRKRINWRLTPERILVRLGLAEANDRTASEVDAHRRITRIAFAAKKARRLERARAAAWRLHRALRALDRAVEKAVEHAGLADNPERQAAMLTRIRAMFSAEDLRHVEAVAPWAALEHPGATGTGRVALAGGATGEVAASSGATREVAGTATDTTPVAVAPAEPTATDTGSGSATVTDTATTPPVAPPVPDRHHATATATNPQADTDTDTGDDTLTATVNAKAAMRHHWDRAITREGYLPDGPELARVGGCGGSYGRRMSAEWSKELDPQLCARLKEEAKKRKRGGRLHPGKVIALPTSTTPEPLIAHVNGHHHGGDA